MGVAWTAAGGRTVRRTTTTSSQSSVLVATRDLPKGTDPFHDTESDVEYWSRVGGGFALIASNPALRDSDDVLQISTATRC